MEIIFNNAIDYNDLKKVSKLSPGLYIPNDRMHLKKDIYEYNGKYYYKKESNSYELINELIGSFYAKQIDLDAVDYKIVDDKYIISEVFYDRLHRYKYTYEFDYGCMDKLKSAIRGDAKLPNNLYKLYDDVMKLTALDLKMDQRDRNEQNVIIKKSILNGKVSLAPAFDFGFSYCSNFNLYYVNPFVNIKKTDEDIHNFISVNPNIKKYLDILNNIPVNDVLDNISHVYDVDFNYDIKKYYKTRELVNNKIL